MVIAELLLNNKIERNRKEGDLEGFQDVLVNKNGTERRVNNEQKFYNELEKYNGKIIKDGEQKNFQLYDEQKRGIAYLYGRESAILGDETGLGKTVQLIIAANMRMKLNGGYTVIITVNSVQEQFAEEVKTYTKDKESEISYSPDTPAKWIVLSYTNFSTGKALSHNI